MSEHKIDWKQIQDYATAVVLEQALLRKPGEEKLDAVVELLILKIDALLKPKNPIVEMLTDKALRLVFKPLLVSFVQHVYETLAAKGELPVIPAAE